MTLSGTLVFFTNWVKACHIGSPDWWVCCFEIDISVCTWAMTPVLGDSNVTTFLKALSLHRFCSSTLTTYVSPFKANSSANWNAVSHQIWRGCHTCVDSGDLNQALPTISSVFHLHNTSATRELSVYLDGLHLRHECHPTYLGVTLDHTDLCPCGETQTMSHIVKSYPLTKVNGGLSRLHTADEDAVLWLTSYGSWNAYEKKTASTSAHPTSICHKPQTGQSVGVTYSLYASFCSYSSHAIFTNTVLLGIAADVKTGTNPYSSPYPTHETRSWP